MVAKILGVVPVLCWVHHVSLVWKCPTVSVDWWTPRYYSEQRGNDGGVQRSHLCGARSWSRTIQAGVRPGVAEEISSPPQEIVFLANGMGFLMYSAPPPSSPPYTHTDRSRLDGGFGWLGARLDWLGVALCLCMSACMYVCILHKRVRGRPKLAPRRIMLWRSHWCKVGPRQHQVSHVGSQWAPSQPMSMPIELESDPPKSSQASHKSVPGTICMYVCRYVYMYVCTPRHHLTHVTSAHKRWHF